MDIEAIRTLVVLADTSNFSRAAERLFVTQSTVSARIKTLEDSLGQQLLERSHRGAVLTPAGRRFYRHAVAMLRVWQRARQEARLPEGAASIVTLGAHVALANPLLIDWTWWMRENHPTIAVHVEADYSDAIALQVAEGLMDIGVVYNPAPRSGLIIDQLLEDTLVMVSTRPGINRAEAAADYVYIDWGYGYVAAHGASLPELEAASIAVGSGSIGLGYLLTHGGTAYLPARTVAPLLEAGQLFPVAEAPEFTRPVYATYPASPPDRRLLDVALSGLKAVISR